jgi:hypothetical protein
MQVSALNFVSHPTGDKHRLRVSHNRALKIIFGHKRNAVTVSWRKLHIEEPHILYSSPIEEPHILYSSPSEEPHILYSSPIEEPHILYSSPNIIRAIKSKEDKLSGTCSKYERN